MTSIHPMRFLLYGACLGLVLAPAAESRACRRPAQGAAKTTVQAGSLRLLNKQMAAAASSINGHVGAAAMLVETGETVSFHGNERFPMQSVCKLPIAIAVLQAVDRGWLSLSQEVAVGTADLVPAPIHSPIRAEHPNGASLTITDLLRFMIVESDGTASDVLMNLVGGPGRVTAAMRGIGVTRLQVATTERDMLHDDQVQYRNWATPSGVTRLLDLMHEGSGLSQTGRALLLRLMTETGTGPHRIKGLLPARTVVAHKTGSSDTVDGLTRATNDAGLITLLDGRHLAVAVFVSDSRADEAAREAVIARIARAAWDAWQGN